MSFRSLPRQVFAPIKMLQPAMFSDLSVFSRRYCDPKYEISGWNLDGRSNQGEFRLVMDKVIWHAPDINETGIDQSAINC